MPKVCMNGTSREILASCFRYELSRYYYAMVDDPRGSLVEASIQLLFILLDYTPPADIARSMQLREQAEASGPSKGSRGADGSALKKIMGGVEPGMGNLFCSFVSRLHQNDVCVCHM